VLPQVCEVAKGGTIQVHEEFTLSEVFGLGLGPEWELRDREVIFHEHPLQLTVLGWVEAVNEVASTAMVRPPVATASMWEELLTPGSGRSTSLSPLIFGAVVVFSARSIRERPQGIQ
jgi:hypothetical protein